MLYTLSLLPIDHPDDETISFPGNRCKPGQLLPLDPDAR
jgi:hypothetical protein